MNISICACFVVIFGRPCGTKRVIEGELGCAAFRSPQCREAHHPQDIAVGQGMCFQLRWRRSGSLVLGWVTNVSPPWEPLSQPFSFGMGGSIQK